MRMWVQNLPSVDGKCLWPVISSFEEKWLVFWHFLFDTFKITCVEFAFKTFCYCNYSLKSWIWKKKWWTMLLMMPLEMKMMKKKGVQSFLVRPVSSTIVLCQHQTTFDAHQHCWFNKRCWTLFRHCSVNNIASIWSIFVLYLCVRCAFGHCQWLWKYFLLFVVMQLLLRSWMSLDFN